MPPHELPAEVRRLIETSIPTLEALEIVLALARDPGREWHASMLPQLLHPTVVSESNVSGYLQVLEAHGILVGRPDQRYVFQPRTPELVHAIEDLIVAYHQRPVTLVRTVYGSARIQRIQSFADAFRLRKEP